MKWKRLIQFIIYKIILLLSIKIKQKKNVFYGNISNKKLLINTHSVVVYYYNNILYK